MLPVPFHHWGPEAIDVCYGCLYHIPKIYTGHHLFSLIHSTEDMEHSPDHQTFEPASGYQVAERVFGEDSPSWYLGG